MQPRMPAMAPLPSSGPHETGAGPLELHDLRSRPACAPPVAAWLHQEWYRHQGVTPQDLLERWRSHLPRHRLGNRGLPAIFVACRQQEPVGTFTLETVLHPLTDQPMLCLCNVFVAAPVRGQGLGQRLCEAAVRQARELRAPRLSLFTTSHAGYYAALGWQYVDLVPMRSRGQDDVAMLMTRAV